MIFSSKRDGSSWQVFVSKLVGQGATLVVIKAKDGAIFGGYADDNWEYCNTNWYGNSTNFLFRLRDAYGRWGASSGTNDHYQYLCWGKKSLPNGLGMGGQFDYAGLWVDSDFIHGHSRAGPLCTTYLSPQLSNADTFLIDKVEVWLVRPLVKDEQSQEGSGGGVLGHAEDMEFMEMAGKKMYSKDLGPEPTVDDDSSSSSSE
ncbi:TLD-domain-containing protein [Parasitella parasitica]|nr:TLD-domain-containing protein [Parasitella parasitica]